MTADPAPVATPSVARLRRGAILRRLRRGGGRGRWTWPTSLVFALVTGALVLVVEIAVLAVLLGFGLRDSSRMLHNDVDKLMAGLQEDLQRELQGVQHQADALARLVEDGYIDVRHPETAEPYLRATIGNLDYVTDVGLLRDDLVMERGTRMDDGHVAIATEPTPPENIAAARDALAADWAHWGPPVWLRSANQALLVYSVTVPATEDRPQSVAFAGITSRSLSTVLRSLDNQYKVRAFLLTADNRVLAHPYLESDNFFYSMTPDKPLPDAYMLQDPVVDMHLAARDSPQRHSLFAAMPYLDWMLQDLGGNLVEVDGQWLAVIERPSIVLDGQRVTLAAYFPASRLQLDLQRIGIAVLACAIALVVGVVGAALVGRMMARPLRIVSGNMGMIAALDFESIPPLPRSRVREIDTVADAFNRMIHALSWFETYVPRPLVRRLVQEGSGTRIPSRFVEAAVMFSDIAGFTSLSERLAPEATAALLNDHFGALSACVAEADGNIDKYIGDSMMAVWGHEDARLNAERAVRAVDAIRLAILADNAARRARGAVPLQVRLGLHLGPVVAGNIGGSDRMNYTVVGDTVNIAQRLEQMNRELQPDREVSIIVSATVVALAGLQDRVTAAGAHAVKGRVEPVDVFLLNDIPA